MRDTGYDSEILDHIQLPEESLWYDGSISGGHFEYRAACKVGSGIDGMFNL